ncbi:uncharacterized protein VICG_00182 [Vittaforma corneae ATCC 50505]|uniref:Uncharacterized protein n=1 Tax=Vittaforma corneae (strain ATCC 50505) TaxID=993615 RepID=L2GRB3_VITCO|nr:uncharacterized protein VICG_00182 [Vittaforma corneae ATCC 50505]ELA42867.1 hypothetical protein VICG_00182 [Vittaforma corneae ATCC 50505]
MKILFVLLAFILCDNIEISTNDFKELHVQGTVLRSSEISWGNSVKLSHLGNSIYQLEEMSPKIFKVVDKTEYFKDTKPAEIRIDVEKKICGLPGFVWSFILFNVTFNLSLGYLISKTIRSLCQKYLDN